MAGKGLPSIIKACLYGRRHGQLLSLAYQQGALCDAAGIIILQFGIPILFHSTMSFLCWALQIPVLDTPELRIRLNGILSNKHHVLSPKNRGSWSRKSTSVEKTVIFDVFRKVLIDKWLRRYLSVNGRFTKYKFAKGKVSQRQRLRFVV